MRWLAIAGSLLLAAASVSAEPGAQSKSPAVAAQPPDAQPPDAKPKPAPKAEAPAAPKPQVSDAKPKPAAAKASDKGAEYLAQCLRDWDAATHMTKQEWARTCRRVVEGRVKFMREQMK
jgi:hypothetical protein